MTFTHWLDRQTKARRCPTGKGDGDRNGNEDSVLKRWKENFEGLMNEDNEEEREDWMVWG